MKRLVVVSRLALATAWLLVVLFGTLLAAAQTPPAAARQACSPDFQVPGCPINPPTPAQTPTGKITNPSCVQIALPWITGSSKCVDNRQAGGAIIAYLKLVLYAMGSAVGLVILIVIVVGGVQYVASFGDPGRTKEAKNRVTNGFIALFLFLFMYAALNFLVPGGLF